MIISFAGLSGLRFSVISCRISSSMRSPTAINRPRMVVWVVPPTGGPEAHGPQDGIERPAAEVFNRPQQKEFCGERIITFTPPWFLGW